MHFVEILYDWLAVQFYGVSVWSWMLQFFGMVLSLVAADLNARLNVKCFFLWILGGSMMIGVHIMSGLWLLLIMDFIYLNINYRGLKRWAKEKPEDMPDWYLRVMKIPKIAEKANNQMV